MLHSKCCINSVISTQHAAEILTCISTCECLTAKKYIKIILKVYTQYKLEVIVSGSLPSTKFSNPIEISTLLLTTQSRITPYTQKSTT